MELKVKKKDLILIVLLCIVFCSTISGTKINPNIGYAILLLVSIWGILNFLMMSKDKQQAKYFTTILKGNFPIKVIIHFYSIMLVFLGLTSSAYLSGNLQTYINAVSAICIFFVFGDSTLKDSVVALFITLIVAVATQYKVGMRIHDISFAAGYILIYYFIIKNKVNKKNIKWIFIMLVILGIAQKDIQFFGLLLLLFVHFFTFKLSDRTQEIVFRIGTFIFIIALYLYVYIVINGSFFELLETYGISTSGRNYYYKVIRDLCSFSPSYLGLGRNAMAKLFSTKYAYMRVGNIHSDILRMYAECGFVVFSLWIVNYFMIFPRLIERSYGSETKRKYLILTFFTFICYLTDNTELYIVTQYFYILVLIYTLNLKKETINT